MGLTILGAIIGALIAGFITILIETLRKPCLDLQIIDPVDMAFQNQPASLMRALRVKLTNKPLPGWIRWMYRNPASQCHGNISFHHLDGQNVFGRSMILRWAGAPEPNPLEIQIGNERGLVFDPVRITHLQKMDIYPSESADIDMAVRLDNEVECYGWSNESYFSNPPWRPSNWRLNQGRYIVQVSILSSGETISKLFRLINDVEQQDFRLEETLPSDSIRE
ncbi:MAG: hypothetical protein MIO92_13180 [Methanosarcinaceae archaeon]|nr:hypothetical protein [Methanosarcinaceae archaeon]